MALLMTRPRSHRLRQVLRVLSGILPTILVFAVLIALKTASTGLPRILVDRLEDSLSTDTVAVELENVQVTPFGRASIGCVRLFQRGIPLPAMTFVGAQANYRWTTSGGGLSMRPTRLDIREAAIATLDLFLEEESSDDTELTEIPSGSIDVSIRSLRFLGTPAGRVRVHVDSDGRRLELTNIRANIAERGAPPQNVAGEITIHLRPAPTPPGRPPRPRRLLEGHLAGNLVPAGLNPVLHYFESESLPEIFSGFEFPSDPPHADATIDIREDSRNITVNVTGADCLYNGVPVMRFSGIVEVLGDADDWTDVKIRGLEVNRPEGRASGNIHFDFRRHGMIFDATSSLDFAHFAKIADILSSVPWDTYETAGGNFATASGYYAFSESQEPSDVRGRLSASSFSLRRRVPARDLAANFRVDHEEYIFSDIHANLYGGEFDASARLWPDPDSGDLMLAATGAVANASVGLVNHDLFGGLEDDPGTANVRFDIILDIDNDPLRSATGHLSGRVRDARLFRTPLFSGFTDFLSENVPGIDLLVTQDDAEASAIISDNGAHFDMVRVEGPLVSISGDGTYWFSDYLDFGFRVHLFKYRTIVGKTLKYLLYPVSKLLEVEATGPVRSPSWSPTTLTLSRRARLTDEQKYGAPAPAVTNAPPPRTP